ncbi:response regulator transcription factor [Hydrogenophaga flava]|uniref:response regulator transcription factor n=1 Tax=Hydrogenophaga flava TaxID=65657 RepID=UPI0008252663|nr:response regulator [Hydrogenophaga flava]
MPHALVVDDDVVINKYMANLLSRLPGIRVSVAYDRAGAVTLIEATEFDVAIVDVDLGPDPLRPGLKYAGLKLLQLLGSSKTPTIIVSGIDAENIPDIALSLDAYEFVSKPIRDSDLVNKVQHALRAKTDNNESDDGVASEALAGSSLTRDPTRTLAWRWKGIPVRLTMTQSRLVHVLVESMGKTVQKSVLLKQMSTAQSDAALMTHISTVRARFKDVDQTFSAIKTVPAKGYVWNEN